jgi:pilus assembly protein CpaE
VWLDSIHQFALIIDANPASGQAIAAILNTRLLYTAQVVSPGSGFAADAELPALVLASIASDSTVVLDYLRLLHRRAPGIPIVVYGPPNSASIAAQATNVGARYFLTTPVGQDDLFTALDAVQESITGTAALAEVQAAVRHGQLITVFSPKGGSGTTTVAVNMAAGFSQQGFRTVLIDCNLNFGNVGIFFGVTPEKTIVDCVPTVGGSAGGVIDPADVTRSIIHHESGVDLLLAPLRPEEGERVSKDHFAQIFTILQRSYTRVIADTWTSYDERVLQLLDHADVVVVPVTPELPSVRNLGALSRVVKAIKLPIKKFRWVLMRANTVAEADIEDLQSFLGLTIHHRVVSDGRLVLGSVQGGLPFVISHPEAPVAQSIMAICTAVNEQLGESPPAARATGTGGAPLVGARGRAGRIWQAAARRLRGR